MLNVVYTTLKNMPVCEHNVKNNGREIVKTPRALSSTLL